MTLDLPGRHIRAGLERLALSGDMPRHRHAEAYATVLLDGTFDQWAYAGHLRVQPGDVLIQPTLDCHADRMLSQGLTLIRLPWAPTAGLGGLYRGLPIDQVRRAAEGDTTEASGLLWEALAGGRCLAPVLDDAADGLAVAIGRTPRLRIGAWARAHGVAREPLSRAFAARFGVSPARFRSELNARAAWLRIIDSTDPLSDIAAELGYADQSHMTRAVKALSGAAPARWRRSHSFKTARAPADTLAG